MKRKWKPRGVTHTDTHTQTHTHSHTHTHTHSHTHTHTHSHTHTHTHTLTHTHNTLSLSHTHTLTHAGATSLLLRPLANHCNSFLFFLLLFFFVQVVHRLNFYLTRIFFFDYVLFVYLCITASKLPIKKCMGKIRIVQLELLYKSNNN